ncbi:MAG TPA: FtsL-like putative cell division protein [Flavipsychrobacter sp.]|nr:FtsL-like putative cell division protein [Flavipsychrobacter sp.]
MSSSNNDTQEQKLTPAQHVRNDWRAVVDKLSYRAIVKNIPFLAFVAFLCMLYINNNHHAVEMQRELNSEKKVLKELRWKYMDIKSQLLYTKMETQVIRNAASLGLKPLTLPAYKIDADSISK